MTHLVEQLIKLNQKYADLQIKSNIDKQSSLEKLAKLEINLAEAIDKNNKLEATVKIKKEEIHKLKIRNKVIENSNKDNEEKLKEISELRLQVTQFKNDMKNSETTEKRLKDAIKRKREELIQEKRLRKQTKSETTESRTPSVSYSKLEQSNKKLHKENTDLKEQNKILKAKLDDLSNKEKDSKKAFVTPQKLSQSFVVPLSGEASTKYQTGGQKTNTFSQAVAESPTKRIQKLGKTIDSRAVSYKKLPTLSEIMSVERPHKPSPKRS